MSDKNDLSGKVGLDTTDFKAQVSEINRQIRVVESGFRASAASLGDWGTTASGLEQRIGALNSEIDLQGRKVEALRGEYERVRAEKGENSRAAQDLEIKLNKEVEALGKMQTELGKSEGALAEMGAESGETAGEVEEVGEQSEEAGGKAETAGTQFSGFSGVITGLKAAAAVGVAALVALATTVIALGAAVGNLVIDTARSADELVFLSQKTGMSTTSLQEWNYIADQTGVSSDTITSSLTRLVRSMDTASGQTEDYQAALADAESQGTEYEGTLGDMATAFNTLGVSVVDSDGNLRDSNVVFNEALAALGNVENATERDALAMALFGRSATDLNPLILEGAAGLAGLRAEANEVGAVMGEDNVEAMASFSDTLDSMKAGLEGTLGTLAGAFLPGFEEMAGTAQGYLGEFTDIVSDADGDIGEIAEGVGGLIGEIATDMATQAPALLEAGLGIIQTLITTLIANLPTLLPAVVAILTSLVNFLVLNLPLLVGAGIQLLLALVNGIVPQLPLLLTAALTMILTLAQGLLAALPEILPVVMGIIPVMIDTLVTMLPDLITTGIALIVTLITGIAAALPEIIPAVIGIIPTIILTLVENLPLLIEAALTLILALVNGLIAAIPVLIPVIPVLIQAMIDAIVVALPMIGDAAVTLITTLVTGLVDNLPLIGEAAGQIISTLIAGTNELLATVGQVGIDIVTGVWEGIEGQAETFKANIEAFFTGIVDGVKEALGIKSPSTVFADIGENMAAGLGEGFADEINQVGRDVQAATAGLSGQASMAVNGSGSAVAGGAAVAPGGRTEVTVNVLIQGGTGLERESARMGVMEAARAVGLV